MYSGLATEAFPPRISCSLTARSVYCGFDKVFNAAEFHSRRMQSIKRWL